MKTIAYNPLTWEAQGDIGGKILAIAPGYQLLDLSQKLEDASLAKCEILFGNVTPDVVNKMTSLKWVHAQTAGVDMYLNEAVNLPERVLLTNSTGAFGIPIGEYMLTTTLMLLRHMPFYMAQQKAHIWEWGATATNMYGRKVAVVGLGDIGGRYAYLCHMMGAQVTGVVRTKRDTMPDYVQEIYTTADIQTAIKDADIIALAMPGTSETEGLMSKALLATAKKGAIIVNVGRGNAIDQDGLIALLQSGHLGGAALDVTTPEPLPEDSPLWDMPNVVITPHMSHGGRGNTGAFICDKFLRYLQDYVNGRPFEKVIDRRVGY